MNFFDRYTQSRNAAIYAWLHAQNAKAVPFNGEPAGAGDSKLDTSTHVESLEDVKELFSSSDPEVEITIDKSMTVEGDTALVVEAGKTVTLHVPAGVTVNSGEIADKSTADCTVAVRNGGTLIVDGDGVIGGENKGCGIKMTANDSTVSPRESSEPARLIVNGGHIVGKYYAISGNGTRPNTYVEINGGTFEGKAENDNCAIFNPQGDSKLIINGGAFLGAMGIYVKAGDIKIRGGRFAASGGKANYKYSGNGFENTGDCIVVDNCNYPGGNPSVEITAGEFASANASAFASYAGAKAGQQVPERIVGFVKRSDKVKVSEAVPSAEDGYA